MQISNLAYEFGEGAHVVLQRVVCTMIAAPLRGVEIFNDCLTTCIIMSPRPGLVVAKTELAAGTIADGRSRTLQFANCVRCHNLKKGVRTRHRTPPS